MDRAKVQALVEELAEQSAEYIRRATEGYGVSSQGSTLHRLIDQITSEVYGQEFAYCGRKHTVI